MPVQAIFTRTAAPHALESLRTAMGVVLKPGYELSAALATELQEHAKRTTAPYKYPRRIEFVVELPKGPTGKILRRQLRDREFAPSVV
jgi:acyl-coenzyme A synthetase/AMP-(fatty) acid ligase